MSSGIVEIDVAADNRHFRVSGDFLLSFDGKSLLGYFGWDAVVRIPAEIEAIGRYAFSISRSVRAVQFEGNSRLRRIGRGTFLGGRVQSFCIPAEVDVLDDSVFVHSQISEVRVAEGNRRFKVCGDFVRSSDGSSLILYFGSGTDVIVPRDIRVLSARLFWWSNVRCVTFENRSQLRRIDARVFASCAFLSVLCIPSLVEAIDGSAFTPRVIAEIRIAISGFQDHSCLIQVEHR